MDVVNCEEDEVLQKQLRFPEVRATFLGLYRYASSYDKVLLVVSAICALIAGSCQLLPTIIFSRIAYIFVQIENVGSAQSDSASTINHYTLFYLYIAILSFVTQYVSTVGFVYLGEKTTRKIKEHFLEAVLKQNIAIFDEQGAGDIATQLTSDTNLIQDGISQKLSLTLSAVGTLAATFIISFVMNWKLTFMLIWSIFLGIMLVFGGNWIAVRYSSRSLKDYSSGGAIAEEAFGSIKSTIAMGIQQNIINRYKRYLTLAESSGFRMKSFLGCLTGFAVGSGYINVALAFWQGSRMLVAGTTTFTDVVTITLATKSAAFAVLGVGANSEAFTSAVGSASRIFSMIDRSSPIDSSSDAGVVPAHLTGVIEFRKIKHIYPSRPKVVVAEDLNIIFPSGKVTALVGASGSGKSTISHLIERFYDPVRGQILLDDQDIRTLNIQWLRRQIRLVSQEPMLFDTSVYNNIEQGLVGTKQEGASPDRKQQIVEAAAKLASAHEFILKLHQGYQTQVGVRGSKLSGGQKQRIAIARALVADPKVLILDEATSALDMETETEVQASLSRSSTDRTTIIIAHRLSTVRDAENIIVLQNGKVVEQGTHLELLQLEGAYQRLVEAQAQEKAPEQTEIDSQYTYDTETLPIGYGFSGKNFDEAVSRLIEEDDTGIDASEIETTAGNSWFSVVSLFKFVASLNKQELPIILIGLICSIIAGFEEPAAAILFGESVVAISLPQSQGNHIESRAGFWSWMFLTLALVQCLVFCVQGVVFAYCSERLIHRARDRALQSILHQDVAFFDRKENSTGALVSFLSTEATHLAGVSGATLGTILIAVSTLVTGFIVGCIFGWKLALVCSSVIPVLVGCGFLGVWFVGELQQKIESYNQVSASYASEAVSAIHTIAALTREPDVLQYFRDSLVVASQKCLQSNLKTSFLYAVAQSLLYACMGLGFWYGGTLIVRLEYSLLQFTVVYTAIIVSAFSAGLVFSFAPALGQAKKSANSLKKLLEQKSSIDPRTPGGLLPDNYKGKISFRNVYFRYAARPQHVVLSNISFNVEPGQHVAIVGETGSGKSTTISLLERFYDPLSGSVMVDDIPISSLDLGKYRRSLGLVMQEPTLYDGTIQENMVIGMEDESIPQSAIESACKDANIYDFIVSLPDGFSTVVGNRGSKLSGGQKQRLALARALLRDPRILLLDEATSAIDSQSEALIQAALDVATRGRTTITVSHRLSTIKKADFIYVLDQGSIVESGSHEELLAKRGKYYKLYGANTIQDGNTT
ncbi:GTPase-activating protein [Xylographa trunciseda]|nr:GTPase-activating protein [Xylographa trunciseda]